MAAVLKKKLTAKDPVEDILRGIALLARDKQTRVLLRDENLWLNTKMREISRLQRLAIRKLGAWRGK